MIQATNPKTDSQGNVYDRLACHLVAPPVFEDGGIRVPVHAIWTYYRVDANGAYIPAPAEEISPVALTIGNAFDVAGVARQLEMHPDMNDGPEVVQAVLVAVSSVEQLEQQMATALGL
jgi:hypothetical protein